MDRAWGVIVIATVGFLAYEIIRQTKDNITKAFGPTNQELREIKSRLEWTEKRLQKLSLELDKLSNNVAHKDDFLTRL